MWSYLLLLASLSGTVVDEKDRPVEGATVVLLPERYGQDPVTALSDPKGAFAIALSREGPLRIEAYAPGFAPFRSRDVDPAKPLAIVLQKAEESIAGVVRDGTTLDPVEGAMVETRVVGAWLRETPRLGVIEAVSDERGAFRLEGLSKTSFAVTASAPGYGTANRASVSPGEAVELYLFPGSGIYGRLLDGEGKPVEDALVAAEPEDPRGDWHPTRSTQQSDPEGRFALLGLQPGRYRLFVRHEDFALAVQDIELSKEEDIEVEVTLGPGVTLTGRLIDEDDQPLSGEISLGALGGRPVGALFGSRLKAEADADGEFSLPAVPPGAHTLVAESRGYGKTDVEVEVSGRAKEQDVGDVVLERGLAISGKVVEPSGGPVAGAVYAEPATSTALRGLTDSFLMAESDSEGRFVLAGLAAGAYSLRASAIGFAQSKPVMAEAGTANLTITVIRAGSIRGTVTDPEGRPASSLQAIAASSDRRQGRRRSTTETGEGSFTIEDLAQGQYAVEIYAPDFVPEVLSSVEVVPGKVTELGTIRLQRGKEIMGTVVDAAEEPVPGASVVALSPGERPGLRENRTVSSDRMGRFRIRGLPERKVVVIASHPTYVEAQLEGVEPGSEVRVVLSRGGALEGYVKSRDGNDVAGRIVQASSRGPRLSRWDSGRAHTSADGYFFIERVPAGVVTVALLQVDGPVTLDVQSREVEVREGETTYVELESRRVLVQGQVRRGGSPLPGATIELERLGSSWMSFGPMDTTALPSGPRYLRAVASEDGFYELLVDGAGEYRVNAAANGVGLPGRTVAIPDMESFSLDLDYGGALLSGRVIDKQTEAPVAGATVSATPVEPRNGRGWATVQVGPDGVFELALDPGVFQISAGAEGYASIEEKLSIGEGGRPDLVLALSTGLAISGRLLDRSGHGLGNTQIRAVPDTPDIAVPPPNMAFSRTLPDGSFRFDELARGRYNLFASAGDAGFAFLPSISAGTEDLQLTLRPGGKLEALVVDAAGAPVPNAVVAVAAIEGRKVRGVQGQADDNGRIEMTVPAGNLTMKGAIIDEAEGLAAASVGENGLARVRIAIAPIMPE
jgi:hypothetical protein